MKTWLALLFLIPNVWAAHLELARKFAPLVTQLQGSEPRADIFTRVDFDGDWQANNNWDNLEKFPQPETVYWHVIESEKHYFITYAFFYPRDYAALCFWMHCHENDFEGMRVTIEKPDTLKRLETLAHNRLTVVEKPSGIHVMIEAGGHGIYPIEEMDMSAAHKTYPPHSYELRSLDEIWSQQKSSLFNQEFEFRGRKLAAAFGGDDWIVFGLGAAKPAWSWEIWNSEWQKGEWFMDPLKGTEERYLFHPYSKN